MRANVAALSATLIEGRMNTNRTRTAERIRGWIREAWQRAPRPVPGIAAIVVLSAGCNDTSPVAAPPKLVLDRSYVTGNAAAALAPDGQFVLRTTPAPAKGRELSAGEAAALARVWTHVYARGLRTLLEQQRGEAIDLQRLEPCERTFYVDTPFEPLPSDVPAITRDALGAHWLVTMCAPHGAPTVSVGVEANATYVERVGDRLQWHQDGGGEFFAVGVPRNATIPVSPELAVQTVAAATGRRISEVPQLLASGKFVIPQLTVWRLVLDGPAIVHGKKDPTQSTEQTLFVGGFANAHGEFEIYRGKRSATPEEVRFDVDGLHGGSARVLLHRRADMPDSLEPVTVATGGH